MGLDQSLKKKKRKVSKKTLRPTAPDKNQTKAILEVGFTERPDLKIKNPFIQRQQELAEEQKLKKMTEKLNLDLKDDFDKGIESKYTKTSLEPHLASTFNVSMPFKDELLSSNSVQPSQPAASTVYAKGSNNGFMFNPSKVKPDTVLVSILKYLICINF